MGLGLGRGAGRYSGKKCRLVSMFSLTTAFFLVEIVVGELMKSSMVCWKESNLSKYNDRMKELDWKAL